MTTGRVVKTAQAPAAIGPYSQGIVAGGFLFISGQIPLDPATGQMVSGDVGAQVTQVLENLKAILEAAGSRLGAVVRTTVYLADLNEYSKMNDVYGRYFTADPPARSTVGVAALPRGARVEIDVIARLG
ncbi:MAG TPA: RidA family protein [Candidatus Polarisedimenticolia bacterium]|nr:RidA family protein [Candidatus Polarisedimenticolia bacterium]